MEFPRLSPSVARALLRGCPRDAWRAHRLLGGEVSPPTLSMQRGLLIEMLIQRDHSRVEVVDASDFRTAVARERRDAALASGRIPVLRGDFDALSDAAANQIRPRIHAALGGLASAFESANQQRRIEWEDPESGCLCSGVLDALDVSHDDATIFEMKVVGGELSDAVLARRAADGAWAMQVMAYADAVAFGLERVVSSTDIVVIAIQSEHPWSVRAFRFDAEWREFARREWRAACALWMRCVGRGEWWDWSDVGIATLTAPSWVLSGSAASAIAAMEG